MTLLITPIVAVKYPAFFQPGLRKDAKPNDRPKFSGMFCFTQAAMDDPKTKAILQAVHAAAIARFSEKTFVTMLREDAFESPFRKDVSAKQLPEEYVRYITSASGENHPPGLFRNYYKPGTKELEKITDPREFRHGTLVVVSLAVRAYGGLATGFKAGVKLDLRNVQKVGDGVPMPLADGGGGTGDEFAGAERTEAPDDDSMQALLA